MEATCVKDDEAAILAVTDTENVVSEPTPAASDDEKVSQDSKTGSPSKTSDTDDDKEVETVKGTTKTFGVIPVEESEINIDSDTVQTGPDPKVSRDDKGSPEKDDTLTSDKDNDEAGGDDDKDNELKKIEEKHLTPLIEIDPMHEVCFCDDLFTFSFMIYMHEYRNVWLVMLAMDVRQSERLMQLTDMDQNLLETIDGVMVMCNGNALQCITIFKVMGSNVQ